MTKRKVRFDGLDFDDVLLVPVPSVVNSRDDVSLRMKISSNLNLDIPIIASPMKGIVSPELIIGLDRLGGLGILHRFHDNVEDLLDDIDKITSANLKNWGLAIGLGDNEYKFALEDGATVICIDVANGYLSSVKKFTTEVKGYIINNGYKASVMAGNVVTFDGMCDLGWAGADLIRVGIGSGTLCTTRNYTGVGYPQMSAIHSCSKFGGVIADGGIRNSGDAVKAIAAGANAVMIGTLFAKTEESANNGIIYGMASRKLQSEYYHSVKSVEGIEKEMEKDTTLKAFIEEFTYGMKSACTYLDAKNLWQIREASFVVTGNGSIKHL